ncbi:hypothetical protein U9M48_002469 [Paspalum notatum var. saurae]|uniref:Protein kinase domain-containing protein n=1 Tax=Paspalum notatum var. saurae TaxID=547442 RepID=A0AAQ3SJ33_PASNO
MPPRPLVLLVTVAPLLMLRLAAGAAPVGLGLPGCDTTCGSVKVPYPFGIGANCSLPGFNLTCDDTHDPPWLLLSHGAGSTVPTLHVRKIYLGNGTVYVTANGGTIILNHTSNPANDSDAAWGVLGARDDERRPGPFVLSCHQNKFVVLGCNLQARLFGDDSRLLTGCSSFCTLDYIDNSKRQQQRREVVWEPTEGHHCGRCSGNGCCQAKIPLYYSMYDVKLQSDTYGIAFFSWYLDSDINECEHPDRYPCYGVCTNLPGTYECRCPGGSHGNYSMMHGCVKSSTGLAIGIGVGTATTVLVLALTTILLVWKVKEERKKKLRQRFFKQNHGQLLQQLVCQRADTGERMIITLQELEKATNNFDKSRELGGGGHGMLYKGILSSQHVVAIKKAKIVIQKEINEFINEVAILSQVNHRNIVKLLGYCLETEVPLLVYEFISNGTLYKHLQVEPPRSISWKDRLRIAVETARALAYLHSFVSMPVVHRDIKSPNILLDDNLTVKLSDFGASRYIPIDQEGIHTSVQGTFGYLDPMYHSTGHLTEKSDVYSYGVLLIELLTRKKPVSYLSPNGLGLVNHFTSLLPRGNLDEILDPQVSKEGDGEVVDVALLAAMCVKSRGEERPAIRQVEMMLESIQASKEFSSEVTDDSDVSSEGWNVCFSFLLGS